MIHIYLTTEHLMAFGLYEKMFLSGFYNNVNVTNAKKRRPIAEYLKNHFKLKKLYLIFTL